MNTIEKIRRIRIEQHKTQQEIAVPAPSPLHRNNQDVQTSKMTKI